MVKIVLLLGAFGVGLYLLARRPVTAPVYPRGYVPPSPYGKGPTNAGSSSWLHDTADVLGSASTFAATLNSIFGSGDRETGTSSTMGGSGESTDFFGGDRDYGAGE